MLTVLTPEKPRLIPARSDSHLCVHELCTFKLQQRSGQHAAALSSAACVDLQAHFAAELLAGAKTTLVTA